MKGIDMRNISDEQKIYELSLIWKEAEYNFAFWHKFDTTFDWDQEYRNALVRVLKTTDLYEYYLELKRFVALLKDGHTDVWFPKEIYESNEWFFQLPIDIDYINGNYIITNMKTSVKGIVKRYSTIKKIDGVDIKDYIEQNIYPYIWHEKEDSCSYNVIRFLRNGPLNSNVAFLLDYNGEEYTVTLSRTKEDNHWIYENESLKSEEMEEIFSSKSHRISMTNDGIAVITIDSMINDELGEEIFKNYNVLKEAKGYIIDLRENGGGNSSNSDCVASLFIGNSFQNDNTYHPIHIGVYKAWGKCYNVDIMNDETFHEKYAGNHFFEKMYKICSHTYYEHDESKTVIQNVPGTLEGPIVILSSAYTASAAENFINVMKKYTNAIIVGSASYGSTGQPLTVNLKSGGGFRICTRRSLDLNGSEFINFGFKPDIECLLSVQDYEKHIDSVMNKGLDEIRKMMNR